MSYFDDMMNMESRITTLSFALEHIKKDLAYFELSLTDKNQKKIINRILANIVTVTKNVEKKKQELYNKK